MKTIPFIDLKAQYLALKDPIQSQIQKVLDHGQFILGPEVDELEKKLSAFTGAKHSVVSGSGTDAAIIAMMALGIGPGDEVILPAFSFIATAETVVLVGATPVYVDIDPITYNLDPNQLEAALSNKTKAIQPVSLYGHPAAMNEINAFAKKHGLLVIEDAAQSFGAIYHGQRSGHLSHVGVTSFFPAKPLGCYGDGGASFTDDDAVAEAMREVRGHGSKIRYHHTRIGINGRLDTLQCAILLPKLERFPWELDQRDRIAANFTQAFKKLRVKGIIAPQVLNGCRSAWAQYTLLVPHRDQFQKAMSAKGIPTTIHYPKAMPDQPAYQNIGRCLDVPISRRVANEVVSLPMYPDMSEDIMNYIIEAVVEYSSDRPEVQLNAGALS